MNWYFNAQHKHVYIYDNVLIILKGGGICICIMCYSAYNYDNNK